MVYVERVNMDKFKDVFVTLKNGRKILFIKTGLSNKEIERIKSEHHIK